MLVVFGAILIGLLLGLLGAGGSILMVPVLCYLVGYEVEAAIAGSLFVVGGIAALAALPHVRGGTVHWRSVLLFGSPGMVGAYLAGQFLAPQLAVWFGERAAAIELGLLAAILLLAGWFMARPLRLEGSESEAPRSPWKPMVEGLAVGVVTGLVGVGGGFVIVPALVLLGGLDLRRAVGTSLVIVTAKSFAGFGGWFVGAGDRMALDFGLLAAFVAVGAVASFAGRSLGGLVPPAVLTRGFAGLLFAIGFGILAREGGLLSV